MTTLAPVAEAVGALLKARGETVGVAESSTGGLISAALLAVPGASAYFVGGGVVYTQQARAALLRVRLEDHPGMRASTEPYAVLCATAIRDLLGTSWGVAETGATGPAGNRYGDAAGHSCFAVVGKVGMNLTERAMTLETGKGDRLENMIAFANQGLLFLLQQLEA